MVEVLVEKTWARFRNEGQLVRSKAFKSEIAFNVVVLLALKFEERFNVVPNRGVNWRFGKVGAEMGGGGEWESRSDVMRDCVDASQCSSFMEDLLE